MSQLTEFFEMMGDSVNWVGDRIGPFISGFLTGAAGGPIVGLATGIGAASIAAAKEQAAKYQASLYKSMYLRETTIDRCTQQWLLETAIKLQFVREMVNESLNINGNVGRSIPVPARSERRCALFGVSDPYPFPDADTFYYTGRLLEDLLSNLTPPLPDKIVRVYKDSRYDRQDPKRVSGDWSNFRQRNTDYAEETKNIFRNDHVTDYTTTTPDGKTVTVWRGPFSVFWAKFAKIRLHKLTDDHLVALIADIIRAGRPPAQTGIRSWNPNIPREILLGGYINEYVLPSPLWEANLLKALFDTRNSLPRYQTPQTWYDEQVSQAQAQQVQDEMKGIATQKTKEQQSNKGSGVSLIIAIGVGAMLAATTIGKRKG